MEEMKDLEKNDLRIIIFAIRQAAKRTAATTVTRHSANIQQTEIGNWQSANLQSSVTYTYINQRASVNDPI